MFPLLFAATLNWIWVKQQIQGLWLGWEGNLSQAETQANKPTRPKSTRKKYNYCVWKRQSWPDDHFPCDPFPQYPYPSFCEISIFSTTYLFFFSHRNYISLLYLDHTRAMNVLLHQNMPSLLCTLFSSRGQSEGRTFGENIMRREENWCNLLPVKLLIWAL